MSATALGCVELTETRLQEIIDKAKQWANLYGLQMKPQTDPNSRSTVEYAPMTLFPSLMPLSILQEAKSLQTHYNTLMHQVAHDHVFLEQSLHNVVQVDEFTKMLWDIYMNIRTEGVAQAVSLGLFRNDYMLDVKDSCCDINGLPVCLCLKQIEFNTIAASFGGLSSAIWNVHRYTLSHAGVDFSIDQVPENQPSEGLACGLVKAWEIYNQPSAVIVVVKQAVERNSVDQKWIEKKVFEINKDIHVVYISFDYARLHSQLDTDKRFFIDNREVAVIYFRDGYSPASISSNKETDVRLMMERSRAIKCPSIHYQLAGCKKIQQELAAPGNLERFIKDRSICDRIRNTFAGQYSLDMGSEGDKAIAMAIKSPHKFVLKPQREGGGNNLYGDDIAAHLSKIKDTDERNAFILMERIFPWPQRNHLLKEGKDWRITDVISELGIYGVYIGSEKEELYNNEVGYLLRTKSNTDNEGGIVAGFATIDSPFLV